MVSGKSKKYLLKVSMTKEELCKVFSYNIKKYRQGKFTQEALAEKAGLSPQQINGIEGGRKFVSTDSLLKIASALNVEVYQLFIPKNETPIIIEETPENEKLRAQLRYEVVEEVRHNLNRVLDKIKKDNN